MVIIYSVILFLMGVQASASIITVKPPSLVPMFDRLVKYQERLGVLGILFAVVYGISLLDRIGTLSTIPSQFFLGMLSAAIALGLGLLFGYDAILRNLKDTSGTCFQKLEQYRQFTIRFQIPIGLLGAALGVLTFIANV